ncbi:MAG: SDR family oxidoreductase [Pseudoxanthomonas sp.]
MKILVIGATGLIGSKVVQRLTAQGHEIVAASPATGVDILTGEGLEAAMSGVAVVIDLSNSPSFEDRAVLDFFRTAGRNLAAAETKAGVKHHVALSVVGTQKLAASGYFRGKIAQEALIRDSGIPYTIVHSTQFYEFLGGIIKAGTEGETVRLSPAYVQPIASDDVADAVTRFALAAPANGIVEIAGPERERLSELAKRFMGYTQDSREVISDVHAPYFGAELEPDSLVPGKQAWLASTSLQSWFSASEPARAASANAH